MSGDPYPKSGQLARGLRRYRRKVASPKQWQAIVAAKLGPCRVCCDPGSNGYGFPRVQFHHLVPRGQGGDDVQDNIVPICGDCHGFVTQRHIGECQSLGRSLTDAERAYVVGKLGQGGMFWLFGVAR